MLIISGKGKERKELYGLMDEFLAETKEYKRKAVDEMAADTGWCSIYFDGTQEELQQLTQYIRDTIENHKKSKGYKEGRRDQYSWLEGYEEERNRIDYPNGMIAEGFQTIPAFLEEVKQKIPGLAMGGTADHIWLCCEGKEKLYIFSESDWKEVLSEAFYAEEDFDEEEMEIDWESQWETEWEKILAEYAGEESKDDTIAKWHKLICNDFCQEVN